MNCPTCKSEDVVLWADSNSILPVEPTYSCRSCWLLFKPTANLPDLMELEITYRGEVSVTIRQHRFSLDDLKHIDRLFCEAVASDYKGVRSSQYTIWETSCQVTSELHLEMFDVILTVPPSMVPPGESGTIRGEEGWGFTIPEWLEKALLEKALEG